MGSKGSKRGGSRDGSSADSGSTPKKASIVVSPEARALYEHLALAVGQVQGVEEQLTVLKALWGDLLPLLSFQLVDRLSLRVLSDGALIELEEFAEFLGQLTDDHSAGPALRLFAQDFEGAPMSEPTPEGGQGSSVTAAKGNSSVVEQEQEKQDQSAKGGGGGASTASDATSTSGNGSTTSMSTNSGGTSGTTALLTPSAASSPSPSVAAPPDSPAPAPAPAAGDGAGAGGRDESPTSSSPRGPSLKSVATAVRYIVAGADADDSQLGLSRGELINFLNDAMYTSYMVSGSHFAELFMCASSGGLRLQDDDFVRLSSLVDGIFLQLHVHGAQLANLKEVNEWFTANLPMVAHGLTTYFHDRIRHHAGLPPLSSTKKHITLLDTNLCESGFLTFQWLVSLVIEALPLTGGGASATAASSGDGGGHLVHRFYSPDKNGLGLDRFVAAVAGWTAASFLVVSDFQGNIFGAFVSGPYRSHDAVFSGTDDTFLFELSPHFKKFKATKSASNYVYYNTGAGRLNKRKEGGLGFGGTLEKLRLSIDPSFERGHHNPLFDSTFDKGDYAPSGPFVIRSIEGWGIGDASALLEKQRYTELCEKVAANRRKVDVKKMVDGGWNDNPDRVILAMGGVTANHSDLVGGLHPHEKEIEAQNAVRRTPK